MDFRQIFRTSKKDERITELEAQVARLTEQNKKLAAPDLETEQMLAAGKATITALSERLEMAHAIEVNQAEVIAQQKQTITDLQKDVSAGIERIRELEHDAAEYAVASARYVKDIAELQGECLAIASENSDLIMFVRKCATGANIRADKPGGAKLVADARVLIKQYDSPVEVKKQ